MKKLRIFGFETKLSLIVALTICASIIIFRNEFVSGILISRDLLTRQTRSYSFKMGMSTLRDRHERQRRQEEIAKVLRLITSEPQIGIDCYQYESERIWIPKGDLNDLAQVLTEQEQSIYSHDSCRVKPGDIVLDAGAHVGLWSRRALALGASRVIAIEPVPTTIECLQRNLEGEIKAGKVTIYPKGVWNEDDFLEMTLYPGGSIRDGFIMNHKDLPSRKQKLPLTTIDRIVKELGLSQVNFIKMDIQGSERQALAGAAETIRRFHPGMAISVYHLQDDCTVIPRVIRLAWPECHQACGQCFYQGGQIKPEVYFFF